MNAWDAPMRAELIDALESVSGNDRISAVVLTGAGDRAFSAGQDLNESAQFRPEQSGWWVDEWKRLYSAVRNLDKPVVAGIRGIAAGSAFQVALLTDVRVADPAARLGQPEIHAGLPSPLGLWLLEQRVGVSRATELVLSGRLMSGEQAHACGLVHHLVAAEEVVQKSVEVADELAALPPGAMRLNKQILRERSESGFEGALTAGHRWHAIAYASEEPQRCMTRFLETRQAQRASTGG
jgi:enoyl-CoA hydratase/carnithine racemase